MSHTPLSKLTAIDRNLDDFMRLLPHLIKDHAGEYALLRHGEVVGFFPTALDAQIAGNVRFDDALFSFQRVTEVPEELGYHAYAASARTA